MTSSAFADFDNDQVVLEQHPFDLNGRPRVAGTSGAIDMGATEIQE
ncbi:MAG: hypothetical protein AAFQ53_16120 [Bacteroidota bacterium]